LSPPPRREGGEGKQEERREKTPYSPLHVERVLGRGEEERSAQRRKMREEKAR